MKFKNCQCCGQKMMVYRRAVRLNMIPGLVVLSDGIMRKTIELGLSAGARSDFTTLRFWGLIYRDLKKDRTKWGITKHGLLFLEGKVSIQRYVYIFNSQVKRYSSEHVSIRDVYPERIDYETIMENAKPLEAFR